MPIKNQRLQAMSTTQTKIMLNESWKALLLDEFKQPYMTTLREFLIAQKKAGKTLYPKGSEIFNAFNTTDVASLKVVILGQDPYHGENQAHGLCFSVKPGIAIPPSLLNIYKEIHADLAINRPVHGYLNSWAEQGVLLLNSVLTVEAHLAASHQGQGWERFTDAVIDKLNTHHEHLVFMLWGSYAQKKGQYINSEKHLVLKAPHPSPLSAHRGFLGCKHFSKANDYLRSVGKQAVNWQLPAIH